MTLKVNIAPSSGLSQANESSQTNPATSDWQYDTTDQNDAAIRFLTRDAPTTKVTLDDVSANEKPKKTVGDFLHEILREQPLTAENDNRDVKLALEIRKPTDQMTVADYSQANWRAIFREAGYGTLTDEEIALAVGAMGANGSVEATQMNLAELRREDSKAGVMTVTTDKLTIEYANRAAQAVLQYQNYETNKADLNRLKSQAEINNIAQDMTVGTSWETGRKIVDATINLPQDTVNAMLFPPVSARTGNEPNFGRAKLGEMYDELASRKMAEGDTAPLPRLSTEGVKYDFRSEMMRRNLEGKIDGAGIKRGDATTTATSIIAPLVVGKAIIPAEELQSLKSLGALPEIKSTPTITTVARQGRIIETADKFLPEERPLAEFLAKEGWIVEKLPENHSLPGRKADALVDGMKTEFKKLNGSTSSTLKESINRSIKGGGQARNMIIDARGSGLTEADGRRGLARASGITRGRIDSVRIVGDGFDITATNFK